MHTQRATALCGLLALIALLVALLPAQASALADTAVPATYIVELDAPAAGAAPGLAADQQVEAEQSAALAAVATAAGEPVTPTFVYRHALNGFAVTLTAEQAAAVAALPGVAGVQREWFAHLHTDAGPAFIGAAQPDLRPALFQTILSGSAVVPPVAGAATGRAVMHYDAVTGSLTYQVFYSGLTGAPTEAALRSGVPGETGLLVADLTVAAVGTPDVAGGYAGTLALSPAGATALFAGGFYIHIATAVSPGGELRGQFTASRGEGMVVGVLDTGIDFTNPSFKDPADDGYDHTNPRGAGNYLGVCNPTDGDGRFDPDFGCNDKLIGAYTFAATDDSPDPQGLPSPRDNQGHGSHTAGTAVGNYVSSVTLNGFPTGPIAGVAPHANLIVYDVCGVEPANVAANSRACAGSAILAGIDQAIADGVDLINLSLGDKSVNPWQEDSARALLNAVGAGIFVAVSVGNGGPDSGSIGGPSNAPWVTGVAAGTHNRRFTTSLGEFAGGASGTRPAGRMIGGGVAPGLPTSTTLVDAASLSVPNPLCLPFTGNTQQVAGKIVVCSGGMNDRLSKARNVQGAGGAGIVIASETPGTQPGEEVYPLPGVQLTYADGLRLRDWLAGCTTCEATIGGYAATFDPAYGNLIDDFSGRGPDTSTADVLKPDLAAPGVDILAADADRNATQPDFGLKSGTSMAVPHVVGLAALLRQIHPDWSPSELKSAMMLTAVGMRKENGTAPATPFDQGAGRITARGAALAGFVLDETRANYLAASPTHGGNPATLNLASMAEDRCVGTCTFTRTLRSTLGVPVTWDISTSGVGITLTTEPAGQLTLGPGAIQTVVVTATITTGPPDVYNFGTVTFTARGGVAPTAAMPVAVRSMPSSLEPQLLVTARSGRGSTRVPLRASAISDLTTTAYGLVKMSPEIIRLAPDPTPDHLDDVMVGGIHRQPVTLPIGNTRLRVQLDRSTAPDMDLYVFVDDGDNRLEDNEILCESNSASAEEVCDITPTDLLGGRVAPVTVTVQVQNVTGSGAAQDSVRLLIGQVGTRAEGNLTVSGPSAVPAGQPFALSLTWSLPGASEGDVYIGVVSLGSTPEIPLNAVGDLGTTLVTVQIQPHRLNLPIMRR